jgi:hypothetical protein
MPDERVAVPRMFQYRSITAVAVPVFLGLGIACTEPATNPVAPLATALHLDVAAPGEEKPVPDGDVTEADENANGTVCSKGTSSGNVLSKDDNLNTPSQPCPPGFALIGKGGAVKIPADFSNEDDNLNGIVCWKEKKPGVYIAKDDNLNTPSEPCPPSYNVMGASKGPQVPAEDIAEADDNDNGFVCVKVIESNNHFLLKDDNLNTPSQPCPPAYALEAAKKKKKDPAPPAAEPGK